MSSLKKKDSTVPESNFSNDNTLETIIHYYNTNSLLIQTPNGLEYGGISAWQGIRYLGENTYIICGTTNPNPNEGTGFIFIGDLNCINGSSFYLSVPNSTSTSIYGPDYDENNGIYSFVGSYIDNTLSGNINGFIYNGTLDIQSLNNPSNFLYPSVNQEYEITFLHSFSNELFVGNSGDDSSTISYIYNINNTNEYLTKIEAPYSKTTTTYGIWYNGNNSYTIVGGASPKKIGIDKIYDDKTNSPIPYGCGFIADYNIETNLITNWTLIYYEDNFIHIEGISKNNDGSYSLNADVLSFDKKTRNGYFVKIGRNEENNFVYNKKNWVLLSYPSNENGYTSSNSVANNAVVGLFISGNPDIPNIPYQVNIINDVNTSLANIYKPEVLNNENVLFDYKIIDNSYISCSEYGVFTIIEEGLYLINFNIYIENTNLPAIIFEVNYTVNGESCNFSIAQKGIDEFGTGTAHSLSLPCVFTTKFNINDTLCITNISNGTVNLITNYSSLKNCVNAIISITKIN